MSEENEKVKGIKTGLPHLCTLQEARTNRVLPKQYLNIWCDSMHKKFNENFAKLDENQDVKRC